MMRDLQVEVVHHEMIILQAPSGLHGVRQVDHHKVRNPVDVAILLAHLMGNLAQTRDEAVPYRRKVQGLHIAHSLRVPVSHMRLLNEKIHSTHNYLI